MVSLFFIGTFFQLPVKHELIVIIYIEGWGFTSEGIKGQL